VEDQATLDRIATLIETAPLLSAEQVETVLGTSREAEQALVGVGGVGGLGRAGGTGGGRPGVARLRAEPGPRRGGEGQRVQIEANDDLDVVAERANESGSDWSESEVVAFEDRSSEAAADLLVVIEQVEDVTVLPWHRELDRARDRYLDHAEVWLELYEDYADGREVGGSQTARISATFELAEGSLRDSAVWLLGGNERDRIDRLFAE
jgi:hypothetical protein